MAAKKVLRYRNRILRIIVIMLFIILILAFWTPINAFLDDVYITYFGGGYSDTIKFKQDDVNWLNKNFEVYDSEFGVCMNKELYNGQEVYSPTKTTLTRVNETSVTLICRSRDNWALHSHPNGYCEFSEQDKKSLAESKNDYMVIWCGYNYWKAVDKDLDRVEIQVIK